MKVLMPLARMVLLVCVVHVPAFAVDYVQCREMLRTKNEMIALAKQEDDKYLERSVYPNCPSMVKERQDAALRFDQVFNCLVKTKSVLTGVGNFYSPEGLRFARAAERVGSDMRKRKCPYQ